MNFFLQPNCRFCFEVINLIGLEIYNLNSSVRLYLRTYEVTVPFVPYHTEVETAK